MTAPWPARDGLRIAGLRVIVTAPEGVNLVVVRIDTSEPELYGLGCATFTQRFAAVEATVEQHVAPLLTGRSPADISDITRMLHLSSYWRHGPVLNSALSGVDMALWDIAGKRAGRSVAELLGGARRTVLPAYASLPRYGDPAAVARNAEAAAVRGYGSVKLHEIGAEQVAAARGAVGPSVALMMDTNCPWTVEQALAMAERVRPQGLLWLEEPVWPPEDHGGLARVRDRGGIPVAAGENAGSPEECIAMMDAGAVDYIQPSVTKIGGIGAWTRVAHEAAARGVAVMPHSPYFGAGLLATLHMAAALPDEGLVEHMYYDLDASPFAAAIRPQHGSFALPNGPGLGCEPDQAVLRRYAVA